MKATTQTQPIVSILRPLAVLLFAVSAMASSVYAFACVRRFGAVFGATAYTTGAVLVALLLGLAVGGWLLARGADRARRPLRLYAWLEVVLGIAVFLTPIAGSLGGRVALWFYQQHEPGFAALHLFQLGVTFAVFLVPGALMGAALPVLCAFWSIPAVRGEAETGTGRDIGFLGAAGVLGAGAGLFLAVHVLIARWGLEGSIYAASLAHTTVGLLALILAWYVRPRDVVEEASKRKKAARASLLAELQSTGRTVCLFSRARRIAALWVAVLVGACAAALVVLWMRVLVFVLGASVFATAAVWGCLALGIALGASVAAATLARRPKNPVFILGLVTFLLALSVAGSVALLVFLGPLDAFVAGLLDGKTSLPTAAMVRLVDALVVVLVPSVLMGMTLPVAVALCAPVCQTAGRQFGRLFSGIVAGAALGLVAAGLVLIPGLALRDSFLVVTGALLVAAVFSLFFAGPGRRLWALPVLVVSGTLVGAAAWFVPRDIFLDTMNVRHHPGNVVFVENDVASTVTVHQPAGAEPVLAVDGVTAGGADRMHRVRQRLLAYVPLIVHADPQNVVQIGYGDGQACGVGLAFGVSNYAVVEPCPGVIEAGPFFEAVNRGSYANPKLRRIRADGSNFMERTNETFDVIINAPASAQTPPGAALYTYEHFGACRDHLKPGGVLACPLPLDLRSEDLRMVVRSFQAALPHCSLWMVHNSLNRHAVLLGTPAPLQVNFPRIEEVVARTGVAADLEPMGIRSVFEFLDCFVVNEVGLRLMAGSGPWNTEDRPRLAFSAPHARDRETCWQAALRAIAESHASALPYVTGAGQDARTVLQRYAAGTGHVLRGSAGLLAGDWEAMNEAFEAARAANPDGRDVELLRAEIRREIAVLEEILAASPDALETRTRLARDYMLLRQFSRAAEQYRLLLQQQGDDADAWHALGVCYEQLGRADEAIGAFERAMQRDPGLFAAYMHAAQIYEQQGDFDAARDVLERVLPLLPRGRQAQTHDAIARLYAGQKQYVLAARSLDRAIELVRGDPAQQQAYEAKRQRFLEAAEAERY